MLGATRPAREPARAGGFGSRRTSQYEQRPSDDATLDRLLRRAAASRRPDDPLRFGAAPPTEDDDASDNDGAARPPLFVWRDGTDPRPVAGAPLAPVVSVSTHRRHTLVLFADRSVRSLAGLALKREAEVERVRPNVVVVANVADGIYGGLIAGLEVKDVRCRSVRVFDGVVVATSEAGNCYRSKDGAPLALLRVFADAGLFVEDAWPLAGGEILVAVASRPPAPVEAAPAATPPYAAPPPWAPRPRPAPAVPIDAPDASRRGVSGPLWDACSSTDVGLPAGRHDAYVALRPDWDALQDVARRDGEAASRALLLADDALRGAARPARRSGETMQSSSACSRTPRPSGLSRWDTWQNESHKMD